jgi:hypothetical protein
MRLKTFEAFSTNNVPDLIDDLQGEIDSSKMRVGPTMDKLPWAMEVAVYQYLMDKIIETSASSDVSVDSIVSELEANQQQVETDAISLLRVAGMGSNIHDAPPQDKVRVIKLKNFNLTARPKSESAQSTEPGSIDSPNAEILDKEFRSARNRGRNIMRKFLEPQPVEPTNQPIQAQAAPSHQPTITARKIQTPPANPVI